MDKLIKPARMAVIIGFLVIMVAIITVSLYRLQIIKGAEYYEESQKTTSTTVNVAAARGNIYDRYGRLLVSNKTCNNLVINADELFEQEDPNAVILRLVNMVEDSGCKHTDTLPVTKEPPFEYVDDMTDQQKTCLNAYLEANKLPLSTTAVELMANFRKTFKIDNNYSAEDMRTIAGVRYEIKVRYVINTSEYVFAQDVSMDLITKLLENNVPGFEVENSYVREYNTKNAAHLLGYTGLMTAEEYADYKNLGYSLNAIVGKSGAELAFEKYLHGTDGTATVTSTKVGTVINTKYTKEPKPGDNVTLSVDIGLQSAAEQALDSYITNENATREGTKQDMITGGAVAAVQVGTGEVLALASWPTYDPSTVLEDYNELLKADNKPLLNRALMGQYAPGSTFKPLTALASLSEGVISTASTFYCSGEFKTDDPNYSPRCWIYPNGHGSVNVTQAVTQSCNVFFYNCGQGLGIDKLSEYAARFGLGESTGIELPEYTGNMSSKKYKKDNYNEDWYIGDTLQAAIGQSYSLFTPLQISNYIATIADNGTRYKATLLKSVRTYGYAESVFEHKPEVAVNTGVAQEYLDAVKLGMYNGANTSAGTAFKIFGDYPVKVATKTGTSQLGTGITNNGVFVVFAPYENPEIAIAVVVEKGEAGSSVGSIAKQVLDYYFSFQNSKASLETENSLLK